MNTTAKVYQVYYDPRSEALLDGQFIPYFNPACNKYFVDQVLVDLLTAGEISGADYFGVVSWRIWQKVKNKQNLTDLIAADKNRYDFYYTGLEKVDQVWRNSESFLQCDLTSWTEKLLGELGYDVKLRDLKTAGCFYSYQICKTGLYHEYVANFLQPMMRLMEDTGRPELQAWLNEKVEYVRPGPSLMLLGRLVYRLLGFLPPSRRMAIISSAKKLIPMRGGTLTLTDEQLKSTTGFPHYTKHVFISELLFPTYAAIHGWSGKRFA